MNRRARLVLEYWPFAWDAPVVVRITDEQDVPDLMADVRPDGEGKLIMPWLPSYLRALADAIEELATTGPPEDWLDEVSPIEPACVGPACLRNGTAHDQCRRPLPVAGQS